MKKIILFLVVILYSSVAGFSQRRTDANINGHVIDRNTKEHIPYINISVKGTTIGTVTDATGHYFLKNLPTGKFSLVVSGIGYRSTEHEVILVPGKTLEVNFEIEEDQIMLESVVVCANRNETSRKEAPVIVNILSPKLFEITNSVCLSQGLNFQPGLRVETNCQNCGYQQVRINGLDGTYSQILIDSRPIFSSLAGIYGIEQIPANMIERVEIVRGGGSALYGANAIAGTINIITREPASNTVTVASTINLMNGEKADYNTSINASVVSDDVRTGIVLFGSARQRDPLDYDGDGFTEIGKIESKNIGFKGFYKLNDYSKFTLEYHNLGEFRRGGNKLDKPPHETEITEQTEYNINTGGIEYDVFSKNIKHRFNIYTSAQLINRKSYYGAQRDPDANGSTHDVTFVAGMQYTFSADRMLFMPAELTVGSEYSVNEMIDKMLGYDRIIDQEVNTKSIFLQNEWRNRKLSILAGGRFDKHNLIQEPVISPRFTIRYSPRDWISMRTGYSSGFRAPQAFDEDLHITAIGGEVALIRLVPDLRTERSQSLNASVDLYKSKGKIRSDLLIEGFYTDLDNIFVLEETGTDSEGNLILERRNGSGAIVKGINLEGKIVPTRKIRFRYGMTLQKSEYKEVQQWSSNPGLQLHRRMFRSPDRYGYITAYYEILKNMGIALSGTYTGPMLVQHFAGYIEEDTEKETPEFFDLNLKLSCDLKLNSSAKLQINGGVQNIFNSYQNDFDKGEFRDAGYIYGPALPRTFFFGIKIMI